MWEGLPHAICLGLHIVLMHIRFLLKAVSERIACSEHRTMAENETVLAFKTSLELLLLLLQDAPQTEHASLRTKHMAQWVRGVGHLCRLACPST